LTWKTFTQILFFAHYFTHYYLAGFKEGRVHPCRVADNTVIPYGRTGDAP